MGYESNKGIFENDVWDIGSLDVGETVRLNITTISNALGTIINGAGADANEYDWNRSNNHDDDSIDVRPVADLSITKLVDNNSPRYGEMVKVYTIGASKEICGGPHAENTKDLGKFRIAKEQSSSAGVRRIKAVLE